MILVIDNFDSFVHNLARYIREAGADAVVIRNDAASVEECLAMKPEGVVISPGPKTPQEAGISLDLIASLPAAMPFFGVCLGHQCLVEAFGGRTVRAAHPLHGEARDVFHDGSGVFKGLPSPLPAGRYHSLISAPEGNALHVNATSDEGEVMGVMHKERPWHGVQFHPESLLTPHGKDMMMNFLECCRGVIR